VLGYFRPEQALHLSLEQAIQSTSRALQSETQVFPSGLGFFGSKQAVHLPSVEQVVQSASIARQSETQVFPPLLGNFDPKQVKHTPA